MSEFDANVLVDGQKTVATIPLDGGIVKDGGEIDATCIVEDSNGKRHKAVKIVNVDDEPTIQSEINAQILNNNNELITVTEEQEGEIIHQSNSQIDFHCLVQKDGGEQLSVKTVELDGEIIKTGGAIDTTCIVQGSNGKKQLAVKVFKMGGGGIIETVSGTGYITLPKSKANGLKSVKLFGGTEQSNLQAGFTQLEYIESTGTQYIDTGLKLNQNNIVEVEYCYHTTSSINTSGRIFGARYTSSPRRSFSVGTNNGYASSATQVFSQLSDTSIGGLNNIVIGQWNSYKLSADGFYIDGVKQGEFAAVSTFETPFTVKLFAFEQASSSSGTPSIGCGVGRCRRFKVWNGDTLVMDLIPAKNISNEAGMYDIVSGQFFANRGTGTFAAGQAVVPTPDAPIDIISNNGVLKYSANMANVNAQTALIGYYTSAQGVVTRDIYNWMYKNFIPVKPNTTYTLSMSSSVYYVSISEYSTAKDSGFIVRKAGNTGANTKLTITTGANTNFVRFGTNLDRTEVTLEEVLAINWMLNEGATAIPYAPYAEGGIYTDGTVETVRLTGKNLFDKNTALLGDISTNGSYTSRTYRVVSDYIPVRFGQTFVGSGTLQDTNGVDYTANVIKAFYKADKSYISGSRGSVTGAFTINDNECAYIRIVFFNQSLAAGKTVSMENSVLQLELGSTPTAYTPYFNGGTATAEMLLSVSDYKDIQSVLDGAVTRNVGIKVLDGTEDWREASVKGVFFCDMGLPSITGYVKKVFCTHYLSVNTGNSSMPDLTVKLANTVTFGVAVHIKDLQYQNDIASFVAYLVAQYNAGTPVIVVYPLETATTETVTSQALQVQAGTNVLQITQASIDNLPLEVTYKRGK